MKLSVVATLYQSAPFIAEFHRRVSEAAQRYAGENYEIVLVNDGSPDGSLAIAVELAKSDPRTVVVDLSRNFGHHKAMMTGMAHAKGGHIFLLDSDLEEDPAWLDPFAAIQQQTGADVVFGVQERRSGRLFEKVSGYFFYRIFRALSGLALPDNVVVARLMTRRYVSALLLHGEREVFIDGLWVITGFKQLPIKITKVRRTGTTYTLRRKLAQFVDSVTSFSNRPLMGILAAGTCISILAFFFIFYLIANRLMWNTPTSGWTSVMASLWLLGGFIMMSLGILGIYISKLFSEVKQRPYTIVREIYGRGQTRDQA